MGQPERRDPAQAQPLPVAMLMEMLIQQAWDIHPDQLREQQGNIIHPLGRDAQRVAHPLSVPESSVLDQI